MKTQSTRQQKQLQYFRPYLCQWAGDSQSDSKCIELTEEQPLKREAGRARAAPHIKTYIRYSDTEKMDRIDWAMLTSANLSTQAWGTATNASGEMTISSWEIGVVIWPELFDETPSRGPREQDAIMVPCFKQDQPSGPSRSGNVSNGEPAHSVVVGFRMPYDLPLTPYRPSDEPWCATTSHHEPDWQGQRWVV